MLTRKKILLIVLFAALAVRAVFAVAFANSFFASYHLVPGLDMQTLLRFSEWQEGGEYAPFFTFHRVWLYLVWLAGGKNHILWATYLIQTLLGCAGIVALTDSVLKLTRKRLAALICGIAASLYLPLLVYEFSILQETFMVNFALIFFWSALNALRKRFSIGSSANFAVSAFAALAGRPTALFFCSAICLYCAWKMQKRHLLKKFLPAAAGIAVLLFGATLFNWHFFRTPTPFYMVMGYSVEYNTGIKAGTEENSRLSAWMQSGKKALMRTPQLFKAGELPENQNIYFWCEKIPQFNFLISPGLLIPFAAAGIMVLLLSGAWKSRYGLLLIPIITMALPLCVREVIGRYRLMLVPYFFMISACAVVIFLRLKTPQKRGIALFGAGAGAFFAIWNSDVPERIRQSDYCSYAIAAAQTPDTDPEVIFEEHMTYLEKSRSQVAFNMLMDQLLKYRATEQLRAITAKEEKIGRFDPDEIYYFNAWSYALDNQPYKVWENLCKIKNKLPPDKHQKALMLSNDTRRILNNAQK